MMLFLHEVMAMMQSVVTGQAPVTLGWEIHLRSKNKTGKITLYWRTGYIAISFPGTNAVVFIAGCWVVSVQPSTVYQVYVTRKVTHTLGCFSPRGAGCERIYSEVSCGK